MTKIIKLKSENIKRIEAVEITPDGNVVVIGGENGAGKSSVLDSIMYALGGTRTVPDKPIRNGEEEGRVTVDLGDLVVKRVFKGNGPPKLVVESREGASYKSPQTILNDLVGRLTFDPMEFARSDDKAKAGILMEALGVDVTGVKSERQALYEKRRDANRVVKSIQAKIDNRRKPADHPSSPPSASDAMASLSDAKAFVSRKSALESLIGNTEKEIEEIERLWKSKKQSLKDMRLERDEMDREPNPDIDDLIRKVQDIDQQIANWNSDQELIDLHEEIDEALSEWKRYNEAVAHCDGKIKDAFAKACESMPGVSIDPQDEFISYNGVPIDQISQAESICLSARIAAMINPKLRVMMIRDGSLLDQKHMETLSDLAQEMDLQLWVERVGDLDKGAVVIEDGRVRNS